MIRADAMREWYRRLPLQRRFALHVILLVAVLFAILIPAVLLIQESAILRTARENGLRLATIFAFSSVQALVADDFLALRQVVNSLGRERDVRYAMILNLDGRVLIHSRAAEIGAVYRDPLTVRALAAAGSLVQEVRSPQDETLYDFGTPVLVLNQRRGVARIGISIADEIRLIRRTRNTILGLGMLTLVVGLFWTHLQARRLTRPIQALARGARAVAQGDLAHRIELVQQDEVGFLAQAFNRMAESLQVRFEVNRELSSTLNLQAVLESLVRHAQRLCGTDLAFLAYRDHDAPHATVAACAGATGNAIRAWIIRPGRGRAGRVLSEGRPPAPAGSVTPEDPEESRVLADEGLQALALVPIRLQQTCVGVLGAGSRRADAIEGGTEEMLQRLADQAAVALANALAYREIELLNLSLEAKVAARTRDLTELNAALTDSHRQLQALDRLKSEFVSNVSHELRTPLTAIRMSVDNLLDGITGEVGPTLQRYLARVKNNTDRLVRLITDLLDLSRIEAGRAELHPAAVSVPEVIHEVVESLRPMAAAKGLALTVVPEPSAALAFADRDKLLQVLINLVENAVKFTPTGGRIDISTRVVAGRPSGTGSAAPPDGVSPAQYLDQHHPVVEVTVADTGEGIPPEELGAIFEKFHQVRHHGQRKAPGTGLGLPIARSLIELQGGRIWVESEVGRGTRFVFILPVADGRSPAVV